MNDCDAPDKTTGRHTMKFLPIIAKNEIECVQHILNVDCKFKTELLRDRYLWMFSVLLGVYDIGNLEHSVDR